jgi:hypothetical protein
MVTKVSKEHNASIFRLKVSYPEDDLKTNPEGVL